MTPEKMDGKPTRRFQRKLTSFLCQEMLFEYLTGKLDSERKTDVEAFLANDKESKEALKSLEAGIEYGAQLGKAKISDEVFQKLSASENFQSAFTRTIDWRTWPEAIRWSLSAVMVSCLVAAIITLIPWNKLPNLRGKASDGTVVLADIPVGETIESAELPADETEGSGDETSGDEHEAPGSQANIDEESFHASIQQHPAPVAPIVKPTPLVTSMATPVAATPKPKPQPQVATKVVLPQEPQVADSDLGPDSSDTEAPLRSASEGEATESESAPPVVVKTEKQPRGLVYRAFMNLPNADEASPEIAEKLTSLGAEKAGEVSLGWKRGRGSYFHFALPESNEESALEMLRSYGPVRISKDPHPRVMPEGQIRFILWIEPET